MATDIETRIRDELRKGHPVSFDGTSTESDKTVSATFLRALIVERLTNPAAAPVGIAITGAIVDGDISCQGFGSAGNPLPALDLSGCDIRGTLALDDSCWTSIKLEKSTVKGLTAPRLRVDNGLHADELTIAAAGPTSIDLRALISGSDVELRHLGRGTAPCSLILRRARINGGLVLSGAYLKKANDEQDGDALSMDGAEVTASVYLQSTETHRFEADGVVSLLGAKIGGVVNCDGAHLRNDKGNTLSMDGAEVMGSVYLQHSGAHRFEADGAVSLSGAKIGGTLDCTGAYLKGITIDKAANIEVDGNPALAMDGVEVKGTVFLRACAEYPFETNGSILLRAAKIGGVIECVGAQLRNADGTALLMEGADVTGDVLLEPWSNHAFEASGSVDLSGANIGGSLRCAGRIESSETAIDLDAARVRGRLHVRLGPGSRGAASLRGAQVAELDDGAGWGWGGEPHIRSGGGGITGVRLRLNGFTYERLGNWTPPPPPAGWHLPLWYFRRIIGAGVPQNIWWNRRQWLDRQYIGDKPCHEDFFPQPHEQLSKVLRLMGHNYDARRIANHKFFHESRCGADEIIARIFMYPHRWFFGCGYLPTRALVTVSVWLLAGWAFISCALDHNARKDVVFVKAVTGVELVRALSDPDIVPKSPTLDEGRDRTDPNGWTYAPHTRVDVRDIPCTNISPLLYALDTMLPVVQLRMEERCEMSDDAPVWRFGRAFYALVGWIIVGLAALTWTGVLQRDLK